GASTAPVPSSSAKTEQPPATSASTTSRATHHGAGRAERPMGLDDDLDLGVVARHGMALAPVDQRRDLLGALVRRLPAAGAEAAARGRVHRAGHVALQDDAGA